MANIKTNPNQKTIKVSKEVCNKDNLYAVINLQALQSAASDLKAGAFKLWIYFSKNQNFYEFALSNKDVADNFGIKKDQYDGAVKELISKGYLVETSGNHYTFYEVPQKQEKTTTENENFSQQEKPTTKSGKKPQPEVGKTNNEKWEKTTRNITDNTLYNTTDITECRNSGKPQFLGMGANAPTPNEFNFWYNN